MKRKGKVPSDPKVFLSKVNGGRTISDYRKYQIVYRQGDPADSAFFIPSEKRLARILLLLANFGKEGRPEPIITKISQETLAEMIGTTRSHVSFFMNKFRQLGLIDYNGQIEVHSSLLNVVLRDQPPIKT
jgi:CRP-like cAMP-binding protein